MSSWDKIVPFGLHFADALDEFVGGNLFVVDSHGCHLRDTKKQEDEQDASEQRTA